MLSSMANVCCMCMTSLGQIGIQEIITECGHTFHRECAEKRLDRRQKTDCPVCREELAVANALNTSRMITRRTTTEQRYRESYIEENVVVNIEKSTNLHKKHSEDAQMFTDEQSYNSNQNEQHFTTDPHQTTSIKAWIKMKNLKSVTLKVLSDGDSYDLQEEKIDKENNQYYAAYKKEKRLSSTSTPIDTEDDTPTVFLEIDYENVQRKQLETGNIRTPNQPSEPVMLFVNPMSPMLLFTFNHSTLGKKFNSTSESSIDFSGKEDGKYTAQVNSIFGTELLEVPSFTVTKNKNMLIPSFIDLKIIRVEIRFFYKDKPLSGADVHGTFTLKTSAKVIKFSPKTSEKGTVLLVCPEGHLYVEAKKVVDGNEVKLKQELLVPSPNPVNNKEEMNDIQTIVLIVNQASDQILKEIDFTGPVAYLGDCSGSMSNDNNIEKLRREYSIIWENAKKDGLKSNIAFMTWDTTSYFCKKSWLCLSDDNEVKQWISDLQARGGTYMKTAITDAINTFTSVENVVVICDGDITPFNLDSWKEFRSLYPKIHFHFVALGSSSNFKVMKEMAIIGNGTYTETNV